MAKTYGVSQEYAPKWVSQAQDSRATNYALRAFPNQMAGPRKVDENRCVAAGHLKHGEKHGWAISFPPSRLCRDYGLEGRVGVIESHITPQRLVYFRYPKNAPPGVR